ncbi:hypothetical protein BCR42DRAFT_427994 [Absidia repens]|uniref:Uncharacterized protein n=1 Tax=Absidia repens TaxID=90262 RepID=A0A1X2HYY5_9FUNG|nr:hypothetical protein BCR42DRAFT_427994 [Absidia repens]
MKLWFLSICYDNYAMRPRGLLNMFDPEEPTIYDALLQERPFLHMMLNSRATRNEDRFYAILPLTKYKKLVADHAIASWGITNDVSVRLVLYRLVSFEEKLTLLLCSILPSLGSNVILPSFAFVYQDTNFDWAWQLSNGAPTLIKAIDLITPTVAEDDKKQDQLVHLKIVVPWSRTFTDSAVEHDLDVSGHALACLGLTDLLDELVTVFVPITVHNEVTHHTLGIKLFGHREQNKWIVLHRMVDLVDVPPSTTPDVSTVSLPAPLHRTLPHRSGSLDTLWSVKKEVDQVFHIY